MRSKRDFCNVDCPVEAALEVIGGKWKGIIVYRLLGGTKRFNELSRLLPGITQRMLTRQLRELENDHIVARVVFAEVPPRVEYSLTEYGQLLEPLLKMMQQWGRRYLDKISDTRSH